MNKYAAFQSDKKFHTEQNLSGVPNNADKKIDQV